MSNTPATAAPPVPEARIPRQIPYIIGNEGCERFSFYGMRNILTVFLVTTLLTHLPEADRGAAAKDVFHTFVIGVYFFPLLGGWLADRFYGKYHTIFWLSLVYCAGHACLAAFESNRTGFYTGLLLIALGSGGIKPLVVAFVGDQFDQTNKHRAKIVFDAFYWIINFGSFFASLLMPIFLRDLGPRWAFGIPGALMFIATFIFWLGRKRYVMVPPTPPDPNSFLRVILTAIQSGKTGRVLAGIGLAGAAGFLVAAFWMDFVIAVCSGLVVLMACVGIGAWGQLDSAKARHPAEAVAGARSVLQIMVLFFLVTPFWSLFDQKASTWVLQGRAMIEWQLFDATALRETSPLLEKIFGRFAKIDASQMQAFNPLLVMLLIPLNNLVLFPVMKALGFEMTALRRMSSGIALAGLAWIAVGATQVIMDRGTATSIAWQLLPYALLTLGEVLVSATGLEFAYSQAPQSMKGAIMSLWYLAVTVGNLWVLIVNAAVKNDAVTSWITSMGFGVTAFQMFFFAAFAFAAALAFALYAMRYRMVDHYRRV